MQRYRFALAWLLPLYMAAAAAWSPWAAWGGLLAWQLTMLLLETVPAWRASPAPEPPSRWHRVALRVHLPLQGGLLALGVVLASEGSWLGAVALGMGIGGVAGGQGITFAHELGHSKSRLDRALAWLLMASVNYGHFMVEHYRGHHPRAGTRDDPATARRGESLWQFLPRTLGGGLASAWRLEARRLAQLGRGWHRSPLPWVTLGQLAWLLLLAGWLGPMALLFWIVQSGHAIYLLEVINYIEHYGLERRAGQRFGVEHAWNADAAVTNCFIANLQRHSDHHLHAWKPYPALEALPGPQLPTGYAGCLFLAQMPALWFRVMHPRLAALESARLSA